ncbi:glycosyltransferase, partial [PVC group bacterium]|nr:glycosyltransferase [PVC group bacterium]
IVAVGRNDISGCVDSLLAQTFSKDEYEILFVSDRSLDIEMDDRVRLIYVENSNPAMKRNRGAQEARGEILAFVDDDAAARKDWIGNGYKFIKQYPGASGVGGPRILPFDASFREKVTDIIANSKFFGNGHGNWREMSVKHKIPHGMINSCNYFIHKKIFLELGGYSEKIGYGGEDTEFVYRAVCQGRCLFAYTWDLIVYHPPRPFGWQHIKQRFHYRFQNGKMLWVNPRLYLSNFTFSAGVFGMTGFLLLSLWNPLLFLIGGGIYFLSSLFVALKYVKYDWRFLLILPFAFCIHHLLYYFSILAGFLIGAFKRESPPETK